MVSPERLGLINFGPQHLSAEAIVACADQALNTPAQLRAEHHLAQCPECLQAVNEQSAAAQALRHADAPTLPSDLLRRLCELPQTTQLPAQPEFGLCADGTAVFPVYRPPAGGSHRGIRSGSRLFFVTAAVVATMGGAGAAVAMPGTSLPEAPVSSVPITSVPITSVPGTSVPGTSVPGTSVPGTVPGSVIDAGATTALLHL